MPTPTTTPKYDYTYGECVCGHPIDATGEVCGSEQFAGTCPGVDLPDPTPTECWCDWCNLTDTPCARSLSQL